MSIWVPNEVADTMRGYSTASDEARAVIRVEEELKSIDRRLSLFLMAEDVPEFDMRAGFYYIRRENDDGTTSFWEVRNPDESFREPDSAVVEAMRRIDANADNIIERHKRHQRRERERKDKRQAEKRREFNEKLAERLKFNHDTPSRPKAGHGLPKHLKAKQGST